MARRIVPKATPEQEGPLTAELLGRFVRARRTQANLEIRQTALACGVATDTLHKIELGKEVSLGSALKVITALGIQLTVENWDE